MKYKKIRGIDKSVCTAEQKIAYNLASYHAYDYRKAWKKSAEKYSRIAQTEFIHEAVQWCMKFIDDEITAHHDVDAIQSCLNAGMENYFNGKYRILSSYEEIGKTFPAYYLD